MKLIPKGIDNRGVLQGLLSRSSGKKGRRLFKVRDQIRKKFGDDLIRDKHLMKTDRFYTKLAEFFGCGKHGEVQTDKDGVKQYRPYFCNMRRICLDCFNRYKKGLRWVYQNKILAICEANNVQSICFATYTLHPEIRAYIATGSLSKQAKTLNEINVLAVDSLKKAIGIGGRWGGDVTGIMSVIHPHGDDNPFKDFLHFDMIFIPLRITKDGKVCEMQPWIEANKARAIWQDAQVRFAKKHGFSLAGSDTNLKLRYIPLAQKKQFNNRMLYIFRSLLDDIFKAVKYFTDDYESFIWLEDMKTGWLPHVDNWHVFESALKRDMNYPVKMVKSYGFLRNLPKHAQALNIKQVEESPAFVPVQTVPCEFHRSYEHYYDRSIGKNILLLRVRAKYAWGDWHYVPIENIIGETCSPGAKKKWVRGP